MKKQKVLYDFHVKGAFINIFDLLIKNLSAFDIFMLWPYFYSGFINHRYQLKTITVLLSHPEAVFLVMSDPSMNEL
jgi:hypothetical protein